MDFTMRFYFLFYEACRIFLRLVHYELETFAQELATWIQGLTAQTMPENWRDYLAEELADWEDKGIIVQPHSMPALEKWILAKAKRRGTLPLGYPESDPGTRPDRFADLARGYPSSVVITDTETAGFDRDSRVVYQETSPEFRAKVQQALELLNPAIAAWWRSPGVDGLVRSYDQDDYPGISAYHAFCLVENGQAIVVVDRRFTAGRTAQGIIYLANSGLFLFPKDANFNFRSSLTPMSAAIRALRVGEDPAVLESARSISIVAEMGVRSGAPLDDGTLTVRAKDIGDMTWRDLLRALTTHRLPPDVRALKIVVPGRGSGPVRMIFLSADLLRAFLQLSLADRQAIIAAASSSRPEYAQLSITRAVAAKTPGENPRPAEQELAPSPELPYNQNRSPAAPASPPPIALAAVDAEKKQPAGNGPPNAAGSSGLAELKTTPEKSDSMPWFDKRINDPPGAVGRTLPRKQSFDFVLNPVKDSAGNETGVTVTFKISMTFEVWVEVDKLKNLNNDPEIAKLGFTVQTAYGHEQRHVDSSIQGLKKIRDALTKAGAAYGVHPRQEATTWASQKAVQAQQAWGLWYENESNHKNPNSPKNLTPYPPIGKMPAEPSNP